MISEIILYFYIYHFIWVYSNKYFKIRIFKFTIHDLIWLVPLKIYLYVYSVLAEIVHCNIKIVIICLNDCLLLTSQLHMVQYFIIKVAACPKMGFDGLIR